MHGTLRFILATVVALSHLGVTVYGYNPGVSSVVIFYLLAGMVAYKLNHNLFSYKAIPYYKDRIKRIFPLYFICLAFSFFVYLLGAKSYFISSTPSFFELFSNLTVIPLSYYMYNDLDKFTLLPPVWSLGVELQFYILAPFILIYAKRVNFLIFLSFLVYALGTLGFINTDYFAYRLLVGVLFIFLLGAYIQKVVTQNDTNTKKTILYIYIAIVILSIVVFTIEYKAPFNHETLFALIIGIPLLYLFSFPKHSFDKLLGELSYPIFLLHFPMHWFLSIFDYGNIYLTMLLTLILSIIVLYLEKKLRSIIFK